MSWFFNLQTNRTVIKYEGLWAMLQQYKERANSTALQMRLDSHKEQHNIYIDDIEPMWNTLSRLVISISHGIEPVRMQLRATQEHWSIDETNNTVTGETVWKSNITTTSVPAETVFRWNHVNSLEKSYKNVQITHRGHRQTNILPIATQLIFHEGECKFNGVEIGGVWWEIFNLHSPTGTSDHMHKFP